MDTSAGVPCGCTCGRLRGRFLESRRVTCHFAALPTTLLYAGLATRLTAGRSEVLAAIPAAVNTAGSSVDNITVLADELAAVLTARVDAVPVAGVDAKLTVACRGFSRALSLYTASVAVEFAVGLATVVVLCHALGNVVGCRGMSRQFPKNAAKKANNAAKKAKTLLSNVVLAGV